MNVKEAARQVGVSPQVIRKAVQEGALRADAYGEDVQAWVVDDESFEAWAAEYLARKGEAPSMSVKEAARRAGVSTQAIRSAIAKGTLDARKYTPDIPDWVIDEADFEAWLGKRSGLKRGPKGRAVTWDQAAGKDETVAVVVEDGVVYDPRQEGRGA